MLHTDPLSRALPPDPTPPQTPHTVAVICCYHGYFCSYSSEALLLQAACPLLSGSLMPSDLWGHSSGCRFPPCPLPSCHAGQIKGPGCFYLFSQTFWDMAEGGPGQPVGAWLCLPVTIRVTLGEYPSLGLSCGLTGVM